MDTNSPNQSQKADDPSRKLRTKMIGPYFVVDVQPKTVPLNIDGLLETVSIDRLSIVIRMNRQEPSHLQLSSKPVEKDNEIPAEEDKNHYEYRIAASETDDKIPVIADNIDDETTHEDEYVVDKIVGPTVEDEAVLYRVRRYGYSADHDSADLQKTSQVTLFVSIENAKTVTKTSQCDPRGLMFKNAGGVEVDGTSTS